MFVNHQFRTVIFFSFFLFFTICGPENFWRGSAFSEMDDIVGQKNKESTGKPLTCFDWISIFSCSIYCLSQLQSLLALLTVDLATVGHLLFWSLAISLWLCIWRHRLRRFVEILLIGNGLVFYSSGLAVSLLIHNSKCGWFTCPYLLCHLVFKDVWWWGCLIVSRTERLKWPNLIPMELFEAEIWKTPHKVWMW